MFDGPSLIGPLGPAGTNLPVTPELELKVNATARCSLNEVPVAIRLAKGLRFLKTRTASLLKGNQVQNLGMQPAYEILDLIGGIDCNKTMVQLVVPTTADKRATCALSENKSGKRQSAVCDSGGSHAPSRSSGDRRSDDDTKSR
jgi:hypothetical protein